MSVKILITIPVYNEEGILENNINIILRYLRRNIKNFSLVIANNGSTDKTKEIAEKLAENNKDVLLLNIKEKGRGIAIKTCWLKADADIYSYMDVDISTDLTAFPRLIEEIKNGHDIVIGSRHLKSSLVKRSLHRGTLSRVYTIFIKSLFGTKIGDMQCGFKAVNRKVIDNLLKKIEDDEWFFDTELILRAERLGYRIKEIPVKWTGNPETKVQIIKTVLEYITNLIKLKKKI